MNRCVREALWLRLSSSVVGGDLRTCRCHASRVGHRASRVGTRQRHADQHDVGRTDVCSLGPVPVSGDDGWVLVGFLRFGGVVNRSDAGPVTALIRR
jgi:hypothetical protein